MVHLLDGEGLRGAAGLGHAAHGAVALAGEIDVGGVEGEAGGAGEVPGQGLDASSALGDAEDCPLVVVGDVQKRLVDREGSAPDADGEGGRFAAVARDPPDGRAVEGRVEHRDAVADHHHRPAGLTGQGPGGAAFLGDRHHAPAARGEDHLVPVGDQVDGVDAVRRVGGGLALPRQHLEGGLAAVLERAPDPPVAVVEIDVLVIQRDPMHHRDVPPPRHLRELDRAYSSGQP